MKYLLEAVGGAFSWLGFILLLWAYDKIRVIPDLWAMPAFDLGYQLGKFGPGLVFAIAGICLVCQGRARK
jgi:hypothetical protein